MIRIDRETARKDFGDCEYDGVEYILTQQAYSSNDASADCGYVYRAQAKRADEWDNADAPEYTIFWDVIDAETDEESGACDWDNPNNVSRS